MRRRSANRGLLTINLILWILVAVEVVLLLLTVYAGPTIFAKDSNKKSSEGSKDPETTILEYTVTWKNEDGTVLEVDHNVKSTDVPSYDGEAPKKTGSGLTYYTFAGWDKELAPVNKDTTFTATYTSSHRNPKVVFDLNGKGDEIVAFDVTYGGHITKPSDPEVTGYTLVAWCLDPTGQNEWNFDTDTVSSDITLYAKWTPNFYMVTFDMNNEYATQVIDDQIVPFGGLIIEPEVDPKVIMTGEYDGYGFAYWKDSNGNEWDFENDTVEGNMTLYAHWNTFK